MSKATKSKNVITTTMSVLEWCDEQAKQGRELILKWEGGGDSGWVYFELDGKSVENEYTNALVNEMYDTLDYGSWAGEFTASGEAVYDADQKAFIGNDCYSEDYTVTQPCKIPVTVDKSLWFDTLEISVECDNDDHPRLTIDFGIKNGFQTDEHKAEIERLEEYMTMKINQEIEKFSEGGSDFRSLYDEFNLEFSEFKGKGKNKLVAEINAVNIGTYQDEDKEIFMSIEEMTDPITISNDEK